MTADQGKTAEGRSGMRVRKGQCRGVSKVTLMSGNVGR